MKRIVGLRRHYALGLVPVWFGLAMLAPDQWASAAPAPKPRCGIALLASDIGHDYPVTNLIELVQKGGFTSVIIDWAWITFHWDKTDFKSIRGLVRELENRHIPVAAMYRPRFLAKPSVPEQVKTDGSLAFPHGRYPCFSSAAARRWSSQWGEMLLDRCPELDELIIYNPLDLCQCQACRETKSRDPYGPTWAFLAEAKRAWQTKKPGTRLGVVFNPEKNFWMGGKDIVDTARPFFSVRDDADLNGNASDILEVGRVLGSKAGASLAKVTWGSEETVSAKTLSEFAALTRKHGMTYVLWTFDTLFLSPSRPPAEAARALGMDYGALEVPLRELRQTAVPAANPPTRQSQAPSSPRSPPPLPFPVSETNIEKLPWPHQPPGLSKPEIAQLDHQVWVINNNPLYQADTQGDWCYFHGGLDIVLTNGARIYAMKDGWVKALENSTITIADAKDGKPSYGWSYTHLGNFQVHEGDFVKRGTFIGEVRFHGLPHIHLEKVFSQASYWRSWKYVCFPDDHFTFYDEEPPTIQTPFYFFEKNKDNQFAPQADGRIAVRGDVDIVVAMRDGGEFAHAKEGGFGDRLAVSRIEYTIQPAGKEGQARHFHSFDFRKLRFKNGSDLSARSYNTPLVRIVYKHYALFGIPPNGHKNFSYYIISRCPGDNSPVELNFNFTNNCWQTAARDPSGAPLYPDGDYLIRVTAFDSHENQATKSMQVAVDNARKLPILLKPHK